jgi:parallel beta-helix repeat protein
LEKKIASGTMLILLLTSMLTLALSIQPAKAEETIYIRDDGSVDPSTAPIQRDGDLYTFSDNIYDSIVVERNNIVIDGNGYRLQGTGAYESGGIDLSGREYVTVRNTQIEAWWYGICLYSSSSYISISGSNITNNRCGILLGTQSSCNCNSISGNNITNNYYGGVWLQSSFNNSIIGNNITANGVRALYGIELYLSSNNSIIGNNITANNNDGITLYLSSNNSISGNSITNNAFGIEISSSSNYNSIYGNTLTNNVYGIGLFSSSGNSIYGNTITNNYCGILPYDSCSNINGNTFTNDGLFVWAPHQNSVENNTVNGKPLVYLEDMANYRISDAGQVILIRCDRIRVENLNLSATYMGVQLLETNNSIISSSTIEANHDEGIWLYLSSNSSIIGNTITNNYCGISVGYSSNSRVIGNTITANHYDGVSLGYSSNSSIIGNTITNNANGISVGYSSNSRVIGNTITANHYYGTGYGIGLDASTSNIVSLNNITNNDYGIGLRASSDNRFCHNNFIDNSHQVSIYPSGYANVWDDGYPSGGNYWSDYTIRYPNAQELDDSGIWDTAYVIDENNQDNYPLMEPWTPTPPVVTATTDIDPDTLNLRSKGRWITAYIQLPEGYNAADIDASTILLNGTISPVLDPKYCFVTNSSEHLVDHNNDGVLERMVEFDRATVQSFIYNQGIRYGDVALTISGELVDGTPFEGTDIIFVNHGGDVNNDGVIDVFDILKLKYHCSGPPAGPGAYDTTIDINNDGVIDVFDILIAKGNLGQTVP